MKFIFLTLFAISLTSVSQAADTATCKKRLITKAEDLCTKSITLYDKERKKGLSKKAAKAKVGDIVKKEILKSCNKNCKGTKVSCKEIKKSKKSFKFCSQFYDDLVDKLSKISFEDSEGDDDLMNLLHSIEPDGDKSQTIEL